MSRQSTVVALLGVVAVSIVFGMLVGGRLNAPAAMHAAPAKSAATALFPAATSVPERTVTLPDFSEIASDTLPAVVGVQNTTVDKNGDPDADADDEYPDNPLRQFFFGPARRRRLGVIPKSTRGNSPSGASPRVGVHHHARRIHPDQQPRGRGCDETPGDARYRREIRSRRHRHRPDDRSRAHQDRPQGQGAPDLAPRRFRWSQGRAVGHGDRQSVRARAHGDRRRRLRKEAAGRHRQTRSPASPTSSRRTRRSTSGTPADL